MDNETGYDLDKIYGDPPSLWVSTIFVENPAELDKVMKEVNSLEGIDWQYYELRKDDSMYKDAVKPLDTVKKDNVCVPLRYCDSRDSPSVFCNYSFYEKSAPVKQEF